MWPLYSNGFGLRMIIVLFFLPFFFLPLLFLPLFFLPFPHLFFFILPTSLFFRAFLFFFFSVDLLFSFVSLSIISIIVPLFDPLLFLSLISLCANFNWHQFLSFYASINFFSFARNFARNSVSLKMCWVLKSWPFLGLVSAFQSNKQPTGTSISLLRIFRELTCTCLFSKSYYPGRGY